jgi:GT2 family glycosyltransferase
VVPFYGTAEDGRDLIAALARIERRDGDEIIVSDNTEDGRFPAAGAPAWLTVVPAPLERSSYYARNLGVEAASADWVLFVDSDTRPDRSVLDAYFDPAPDERVGILSGAVVADEEQTEVIARYARSRGHIDPEHYRERPGKPAGITANLLVRRAAWEEVQGFHEGVKSGADLEFCWRVQDAGWGFDWRPAARVSHVHVDSVRSLVKKTVRHAGGGGWVNQHHPGAFARPPVVRGLARSAAGVVAWAATRQWERSLFKAIDGLFLSADAFGRLTPNRAPRDPLPADAPRAVVVTDAFARGEDDPAAALVRTGGVSRVEAARRPVRPVRGVRRELRVTYWEDDGALARGRTLLRVLLSRPGAVLRLLRAPGPPLRALAPAARRVERNGERVLAATPGDLDAARKLAALAGAQVAGSAP